MKRPALSLAAVDLRDAPVLYSIPGPTTRVTAPGRTEWGFSGITGNALRFYTPEPFNVLLEQCCVLAGHGRWIRTPEVRPIAPLLLRAAAQNRDRTIDVAQAKRLYDAATRQQPFERIDEFETTAKSISKLVAGFRSEIVFAGVFRPDT